MINLLKLEFHKLKHDKSFGLIALIVIVVEFIYVIKNGSITGIKGFEYSMHDASTMMVMGSIFTGIFIGGDFTNRYINQGIVAGHSRIKIFFSKVIVVFFATEILMLVYPISSIIINTILNGWGEVVDVYTIIYILKTIFLRMIVDVSCIVIWVFLAVIFKDVVKTVSVAILGFMVVTGCLFTLSHDSYFIKCIYSFTANNQAKIIVDKGLTYSQLMSVCISNIVIAAVFLFVSYLLFKKAELK